VLAGVAALLLVNIGLGLLDSATRGADTRGAQSSSFSTASSGTAGYAELLRRFGHDTSQARGTIGPASLSPASTAVVLDAAPSESARRALAEFVAAGGTALVGGADATLWTRGMGIDAPRWDPIGREQSHVAIEGTTYDVRTDGRGRWRGGTGQALVQSQRVGAGRVVLLADTSPLQNRLLDRSDNAAFGLAVAGEDRASVVFVEGPHGFGSSTGLDAVPTRWKIALVGGALAALLTLIAASRRLGPAEETVRDLAPPRRAYTDALGAALSRSRRPAAAVAPLQAAARAMLARRAGLAPDPSKADLREAAVRAGWTPAEIEGLFAPGVDRDSILAVGRSMARSRRGVG
jgi:hypothetical protein